ncbi:protealysin inhibitor emfourin [Peribacillus sp. SI8-4]|uniref:protealysin inhibitor emfourin n=1 Tax=Peribacillus sp. SI8-4 TaxID=3048009 RepID=UPI002556C2EC|nr:protealysin inhibitor emfourin [Peribacillus sp. SI8-4]
MLIQFSCVGGMANLDLNVVIDTEELPQGKHEELQQLMQTADLSNLSSSKMAGAKAQGADAFSYQLDIAGETKKQNFSFTDVTAPERVRPLLDYLRNLAMEKKLAE